MSLRRDVNALRQLNPARRREALQYVVSMLQVPWVRDHLMGNQPGSDAMILSSPLQQLNSLAVTTGCTHTPSQDSDICATLVSAEVLCVPAYSKDGFSAGYFIEEQSSLYNERIVFCRNGPASVRWIFSELDSRMVIMERKQNYDLLLTGRNNQRKCIWQGFAFQRPTLDVLLDAHISDTHAYEKSLHSFVLSSNTRPCPSCNAHVDQSCACDLKPARTRFSLDLSAITHNMLMKLGEYSGIGLYEELTNGVVTHSYPTDTTYRILKMPRAGIAKRLLNWAICDVLSAQPSRISRALTSPLDSHDDFLQLPLNNTAVAPALPQPTLTSLENSPPPACTDAIDPLLLQVDLTSTPTISEVSPEQTPFDDPFNLSDLPVTLAPPAPAESVQPAQPAEPLPVEPIAPAEWPWNTTPQPATLLPPTHYSAMLGGTSLPHSPTPSAPLTERVATLQPQPQALAPKPIAPRGRVEEARVVEMSDEAMRKSAEDLRAWKAYNRKIRNRMSAARSNLARKERRLQAARKKRQQDKLSAARSTATT